ncbi:thiamine pyrophosphate-binding protein [Streptomyces sp. JJ36]|uniref:thiamine pyrophosphate-binding protein n=1 Tax=Streptomyces sp. JJ36 TaxID=2736645 RepID=UPI001F37D652|nr:thiamine pyrophosphate-binding protein [Streptomyces sp. JJ36]MCF6523257.1 thiamine pyrophosphate-binding protein [Streptomyces sp. JJ36]
MTRAERTGGSVAVESLTALGARTVFGLPGQHALALFDALRHSALEYVGLRVENNAAFAADAHARVTGGVTPLLVSTGPGALLTLPALQEAAAASAPVLAVGSQIPSPGLGGARKGYLHELTDQQAVFHTVVKSVHTARSVSQIPPALAEAWAAALRPPYGPVWVEIPQDVLLAPATVPPVTDLSAVPDRPAPRGELVAEAARLLAEARSPAILAGGGVVRSGARDALLALAETLDAPVATTFGGKGAFPWEHPLSLQSWLEDRHLTDFLEDADVLLVAGSGLGELSSNYHTFRPRGRLVQIEADPGKLEANHPALGIHADARLALTALHEALDGTAPGARTTAPGAPSAPGAPAAGRRAAGEGARAAAAVLHRVRDRLAAQDLDREQRVLGAVREALPDDASSFWDMTILGYWAWSAFDPRNGALHSAQGAGGLGYAFPAALGAAAADRVRPVLAVSGDGGAMYSLAELATARQYDLPVTWLIVDDGGYGILRSYMTDAFGTATGTEPAPPDFAALAGSFGVPAVHTRPESLREDLAAALAAPGPSVVVLSAELRMFAPTHR